MADRLETLLEPGETVLYRHRRSIRKLMVEYLVTLALLVIAFLAVYALGNRFWPETPPDIRYLYFLPLWALILELQTIQNRWMEVLVTERRLLIQCALYKPITTVVPLSEIVALHGLSPLESELRVETIRGHVHNLGVPDWRAFARVLAKAAGLPVPPAVPPLAERVARVILAAGTWGLVLGFLLLPFAAFSITFSHIDLDNITVLSFIAIALTVTLILPVVLGLALGWLAGNLLVLACLRSLITADELRAAFRLIEDERVRLRFFNAFVWAKRLRLRLAGLIYGEAMGAEKTPDNIGSMETNGL